jgi:tetratricopeptide (TPR) repeat protein
MSGEFNKALKEFNRAVNLSPKIAGLYKNRGICYWILGKRKDAIKDLKKAIKLFPKFFRSYYHLGYFMHREKDKDKAKSYFLRAFELYPKVLQEWEKVFEFTTNPQVIQFFRKELAVGKEYLIPSGKVLYTGETKLEVKSIHTNPKRIRVGEKFVIVIEYVVSDPSVNSKKLLVYMNFKIIEGEKVVFKSGSIALQSKQGVKSTRYQNMNPTQKKGIFKVEISLHYRGKISRKTASFTIS